MFIINDLTLDSYARIGNKNQVKIQINYRNLQKLQVSIILKAKMIASFEQINASFTTIGLLAIIFEKLPSWRMLLFCFNKKRRKRRGRHERL